MTTADPSQAQHLARPSTRPWITFIIGVVLGDVLWSLLGPALVGWWSGPLLAGGLSCGPTVERAVFFFVKVEVGVAIASGLLTMLFVTFVRRKFMGR
jgi:hypothetical protein